MKFIRHRLNAFQKKRHEAGGLKNLLLHTAFALTFTSGLSYGLGLVRDKTFAYTFGASSELDVYNAAFVIPDFFLALLVTGALSAAFVPIFSNLDEHDKKQAIAYTNQILNFGLLILAIFAGLFAWFLPHWVEFLVPGFSPEQQEIYIKVTRLMLISPFLFTISNTFGNVLISIKEFLWYGLAPVMYNVGIIVGVFVFAPKFDVLGLVMGTVLGAALHLLIRTPAVVRYGWRPEAKLEISGDIKETIWLMIPKMFQIGMWQVLLWWFIRLASNLEEGSVTIYAFARNFQSVPVSLVGIAIALAAFSELSHLAAEKKYREFGQTIRRKGIMIVAYTGAAAIVLALVAHPAIQLLLGGGEFNDEAVAATASLLVVYCLSVPLESGMHLLARAHFALKNTWRPSAIHVTTIAWTMVLSAYWVNTIGLFAIPAAFAVGLTIQITLLVVSLYQLLRGLSWKAKLKHAAESMMS
jgi:putative peptidoglycan lipid II flippase